MARNLLLVSNSKTRDQPKVFLGYCENQVKEHFDGVKNILFIPYAEPNAVDRVIIEKLKASGGELSIPSSEERRNTYTELLQARFRQMGFELKNIQYADSVIEAIREAEGFYVGGGNTYDLLRTLDCTGAIGALRERISQGVPYLGVSAGTVVAGMNICTSNDNSKPNSDLDALQFVPFNIKPHYLERVEVTDGQRARIMEISPEVVALLDHQGESHLDRIMEFHHHFPYTVVGLKEGAMLKVEGYDVKLLGTSNARVFRREAFVNFYELPEIYNPGDSLDFLIRNAPKEKVSSREVLHEAFTGPGSWLASLDPISRHLYLTGG
ncbi:Type 1 glutamine amidotransferase-like domain-containing protein [Candidatus Woesearchaeota archaeon]|nr:Type 1 glutamine amidotransferase-like domain-containing protein [Candidatus Woesearchaeota archaeon]